MSRRARPRLVPQPAPDGAEPDPIAAEAVELMTLTELCDHCANVHHALVRRELARLQLASLQLAKAETALADAPWIADAQTQLARLCGQIAAHLRAEAQSLFPVLRRLDGVPDGEPADRIALGQLLARMRDQHNEADEALDALETLIGERPAARSGSSLEGKLLAALHRLERCLHEGIYRENQVLFRRAAALSRPR